MHKTGAWVLTIWAVLNFLVAAAVTVLTMLGHAPPALALVMSPEEISLVPANVLSVVHAQAAFANPAIMSICALVIVLAWKGTERWTVIALFATLIPLQAFAFVSDAFLSNRNVVPNLVSSALLLTGLLLCSRPVKRTA